MKKIKKVKKIKPKIKEITKKEKHISELEEEIIEQEETKFISFLNGKNSDPTLKQKDITPDRITRIPLAKEDEREVNFRPDYLPNRDSPYKENTQYAPESTRNQTYVQGEGAINVRILERQNQLIGMTENTAFNFSSQERAEHGGQRGYAEARKSKKTL